MNAALGTGVALVLGLSVVGCGGGGGSREEGAIKALEAQFFNALQQGDSVQLAGLFSTQCGDMANASVDAILQFRSAGADIKVNLTKVDIQGLTADSAEVLPVGTISVDGQESPLSQQGEAHTKLTKEGGSWKIATCSLFQ